jgi:hypothetical protein
MGESMTNRFLEITKRSGPKTGPRTQAGKATASRNALKHGALSESILEHEREGFDAFRLSLGESIKPIGSLEQLLFDRAVLTAWRLKRLEAWEVNEISSNRFSDLETMLSFRSDDEKRIAANLLPEAKLASLLRYEAHLERSLFRSLHELEAMRDRREGKAAPLARLEVHGELPESLG